MGNRSKRGGLNAYRIQDTDEAVLPGTAHNPMRRRRAFRLASSSPATPIATKKKIHDTSKNTRFDEDRAILG